MARPPVVIQSTVVARPAVVAATFVGPGHATITMRGHLDAASVDEFGEHLDAFLGAAVRLISIDGTGVTYYGPLLLEHLRRARRRMAARGGVISVLGLHPSALPARVVQHPASSPGPSPTPPPDPAAHLLVEPGEERSAAKDRRGRPPAAWTAGDV